MLGFQTSGNATITVFDNNPVLSTDPWIHGNPYFGSWSHPFEISQDEIDNISRSKYIWFSHGHPDHLDSSSYEVLKDSTWLIPDHYGDRIFNSFKDRFSVIKIKSNTWFKISPNVKIKSFADWNQDAALIIDIGGKDCICNINDGSLLGWERTVKNIVSGYKNRFLLKLINWGDADMINLFDQDGNFIRPSLSNEEPLGLSFSYHMKRLNCNYAIPFSSFHRYSRTDSGHMNEFITPQKKYYEGFNEKYGTLLTSHGRWNTELEDYETQIKKEVDNKLIDPIHFGDSYSDELDQEEFNALKDYFLKFDHLKKFFGKIIFKVGNKPYEINFSNKNTMIEFEVPRTSLMKAIHYEIFDDLLIGNFMKTKLINIESLYPNFSPYVAKYGDNGLSKSSLELKKYFDYYKINSANYWRDLLRIKTEDIIRKTGLNDTNCIQPLRKIKRKYF